MADDLRERELREMTNCALCGKPFGHTGLPLFWRVTVERFGVDMRAVQRQTGLADVIGSAAIAMHMGPDEVMAKPVMEPVKLTVCETCATMRSAPIATLAEGSDVG